jgi:hypothetical protein
LAVITYLIEHFENGRFGIKFLLSIIKKFIKTAITKARIATNIDSVKRTAYDLKMG